MADGNSMMAGNLAFKFIGNFVSGNRAAAQALNQYTRGLQQDAMRWDQNTADNKAIADANLTNQIRTGFKVGLLNVQRAQAKKQAMEQGFDIGKMRQQVLGAVTANAAAAGTIGSSVDAVVGDIEQKVGDARIKAGENFEIQSENFDTQLSDIVTQGHDVLRSAENLSMIKSQAPDLSGTGWGSALLNSAIDVGGDYMSQAMKLGMG